MQLGRDQAGAGMSPARCFIMSQAFGKRVAMNPQLAGGAQDISVVPAQDFQYETLLELAHGLGEKYAAGRDHLRAESTIRSFSRTGSLWL